MSNQNINIITAETVANSTDYINAYTTKYGYTIDTMTKLEYEVGAATDDTCIDIEYINELKPIVLALAEIAAVVPNAYKIDIMLDWIKEAEETIEQHADYERLQRDMLPGLVEYYRNEVYKGEDVSEEFLQDEAKGLGEDIAYDMVYIAKVS